MILSILNSSLIHQFICALIYLFVNVSVDQSIFISVQQSTHSSVAHFIDPHSPRSDKGQPNNKLLDLFGSFTGSCNFFSIFSILTQERKFEIDEWLKAGELLHPTLLANFQPMENKILTNSVSAPT